MTKKALFLDRDGVLVKPIKGEAPQKSSQLELIPGTAAFLRKAEGLGYKIIVVSNQPDIALGKIDETTKKKLEQKFKDLLSENHLKVTEIYYCFHDSKGVNPKYSIDCDCKKPKPGMLLKAARRFNIDLRKSWMIGDRASDIKAGKSTGTKTILIDQKNGQNKYLQKLKVRPNFRVKNLGEIFNKISQIDQVFILAAGKGERMMPLTKKKPKPMIKILGKPMIEYVLKLAVFHGAKKIGINLFYKGNKIKKYLGKGVKYGTEINYIHEKSLTGSAGGVRAIASKLKPENPFIVISSDMMVDFDLTDIYKFHIAHRGIATICCYLRDKKTLQSKKSGLVVFDEKTKRVKKFIERPQNKNDIVSFWVNSSIYVFNPEIIKLLPSQINRSKIIDLPKDIFPKILKSNLKMYAYPVNKKKYYQLGIDTPDRIKIVENDIKNDKLTIF